MSTASAFNRRRDRLTAGRRHGILLALLALLWATYWPQPASAGDEVFAYISWAGEQTDTLRPLLEQHSGDVLARYAVEDSLVGEHAGQRIALVRWPEKQRLSRFIEDSARQSPRRLVQIAAGHPFEISSAHTPTGDFSAGEDSRFLIGAFALSPGGSFRQCRNQMDKTLDLARQHDGELVASYRVSTVLRGALEPVLFGILRWRDAQAYGEFKQKLLTRSLGDILRGRNAHGLRAGEVMLLQARRLP